MDTITHTQMTDHDDHGNGNGNGIRPYLVAAGLALTGVIAAVSAFVVTGDDTPDAVAEPTTVPAVEATDEATVVEVTQPRPTVENVVEPTTVPAVEATDGPTVDETTEVVEAGTDDVVAEQPAEAPDTPAEPVAPAPEVVVGTDENGDDIVVVFEISQICATTHHQQFGDQPSYIRWVFDAPGLADGTDVVVPFTADGSVRRTTTVENSRVVAEQGIDSYGSYPFPPVEWTDGDGNENRIDPDGQHVVDDREGDASTTCLS